MKHKTVPMAILLILTLIVSFSVPVSAESEQGTRNNEGTVVSEGSALEDTPGRTEHNKTGLPVGAVIAIVAGAAILAGGALSFVTTMIKKDKP